ncbi:hypothetical protein GUJ93_ZPchr0007g5183 [Zizania palustris]|uniref:Uncharacterized protein n=1 Tax=Zizania palustris TaxID=103762 RepID=A0A8J5VZX8_ZIZPA|nr:hypothetical protein GUJ93_ZPchr0007g5183 [Zizania palustris]
MIWVPSSLAEPLPHRAEPDSKLVRSGEPEIGLGLARLLHMHVHLCACSTKDKHDDLFDRDDVNVALRHIKAEDVSKLFTNNANKRMQVVEDQSRQEKYIDKLREHRQPIAAVVYELQGQEYEMPELNYSA